jgi:hypothetical protein
VTVGSGIGSPFLPLGRRSRRPASWPHLRQAPRRDLQDRRLAVLDQHLAVAVDDRAAGRLDALDAHPVVLRLLEVLVAGEHLQVPEAEEDDREQDERDPAEHGDADRQLRRDGRAAVSDRVDHARLSGDRPPVV